MNYENNERVALNKRKKINKLESTCILTEPKSEFYRFLQKTTFGVDIFSSVFSANMY